MQQFNKDIDDYMSRRNKKEKTPLSQTIRKRFSDFTSIDRHEKDALSVSESSRVTIVAPKPNFFRILHDKIMSFFKGH